MLKTKVLSFIIVILLLIPIFSIGVCAEKRFDCKSVMLMEASTGKILLEENSHESLPPASVTKIMTLLLVMEALEEGKISLDDMVTTSNNAASMGGSQVYLEVGEQMSVDEMIKCVVVSSANDAAVALAEFIAGSEEMFVTRMNERARELGMNDTVFENTNGLDDSVTNHVTSAHDIAVMSRELIRHPKILEYSSIWMDTIRGGSFTLTNTNRLIRFYNGANGLKTGSTSKAGFCISATALKDGMQLIAAVMGAPNRDVRNMIAKSLLDYGFANYSVISYDSTEFEPVRVLGGIENKCKIKSNAFSAVMEKGKKDGITETKNIPENISAPIKAGDIVGNIVYSKDGSELGRADIVATEDIDRIGFAELAKRIFNKSIFLLD